MLALHEQQWIRQHQKQLRKHFIQKQRRAKSKQRTKERRADQIYKSCLMFEDNAGNETHNENRSKQYLSLCNFTTCNK